MKRGDQKLIRKEAACTFWYLKNKIYEKKGGFLLLLLFIFPILSLIFLIGIIFTSF